jgi:hypothetical protein
LADDWYAVTVQHKVLFRIFCFCGISKSFKFFKLLVLPANKPIENIMDEYLKYKLEKQCDKYVEI